MMEKLGEEQGQLHTKLQLFISMTLLQNKSFLKNIQLKYPLKVYIYFSFIIHMCIQGLVHFSPLPPPPPSPPHPLNTQQKLFCPYF
jgi:hypothetical protein